MPEVADIGSELSFRTLVLTTCALCRFATLGSTGIPIGGIAPLAPDRRPDLARLAAALLGRTRARTFVDVAHPGWGGVKLPELDLSLGRGSVSTEVDPSVPVLLTHGRVERPVRRPEASPG